MNPRSRKVVVFGLVVLGFLAPLKFSNPPILPVRFPWPSSPAEWLVASWPLAGLYIPLFLLTIFAALSGVLQGLPQRVWMFPSLFLAWQGISALTSVDPALSLNALALWLALAGGFVLGAAAFRDAEDLELLALGWVTASVFVFWTGYDQANGGLEETRRYLEAHPEWSQAVPALKEKLGSHRIFSTFVNPNALGGFVVSAIFMVVAWALSVRNRRWMSGLASSILVAGLLYCLWKSQSKGAYLALFLTLGAVGMGPSFARRLGGRAGWLVLCGLLTVGGFAAGYGRSGVEKGLKTWDARQGYWRAALRIGADHPLTGTGPGTFMRMYPRYKGASDESTKLVHNNYLQMWCDSGLPGFLSLLAWLPGVLLLWWKRNAGRPSDGHGIEWMVWCACAAFAFHSLVDFDLYLPGNAWPVFILLGFLARETMVVPTPQKEA